MDAALYFRALRKEALKEKKFVSNSCLRRNYLTDPAADDPDTPRAIHLGIEYALSEDGTLRWRQKACKWSKLMQRLMGNPEGSGSWTPREAARTCGVLVWDQTVSLIPLCFRRDLIDVLRRMSAHVHARNDWDGPYVLTPGETESLANHMSEVLLNPWHSLRDQKTCHSTLLFTDASKSHMGAVVCDEKGRVTGVNVGTFPKDLKDSHIFVKELVAAVLYTQWLLRRRNLRNCRIHLLLDNSDILLVQKSTLNFSRRFHYKVVGIKANILLYKIGTPAVL